MWLSNFLYEYFYFIETKYLLNFHHQILYGWEENLMRNRTNDFILMYHYHFCNSHLLHK